MRALLLALAVLLVPASALAPPSWPSKFVFFGDGESLQSKFDAGTLGFAPDSDPSVDHSGFASAVQGSEQNPADWINVAHYGAVGDGAADDRAAMQQAIDASCASTLRPPVYVPAGTYKIGDAATDAGSDGDKDDPYGVVIHCGGLTLLSAGSGTLIRGEGDAADQTLVLVCEAGTVDAGCDAANNGVLDGVRVEGLGLVETSPGTSDTWGIEAQEVTDLKLVRLSARDFGRGAVRVHDSDSSFGLGPGDNRRVTLERSTILDCATNTGALASSFEACVELWAHQATAVRNVIDVADASETTALSLGTELVDFEGLVADRNVIPHAASIAIAVGNVNDVPDAPVVTGNQVLSGGTGTFSNQPGVIRCNAGCQAQGNKVICTGTDPDGEQIGITSRATRRYIEGNRVFGCDIGIKGAPASNNSVYGFGRTGILLHSAPRPSVGNYVESSTGLTCYGSVGPRQTLGNSVCVGAQHAFSGLEDDFTINGLHAVDVTVSIGDVSSGHSGLLLQAVTADFPNVDETTVELFTPTSVATPRDEIVCVGNDWGGVAQTQNLCDPAVEGSNSIDVGNLD